MTRQNHGERTNARMHALPQGATINSDGSVTFRIWAPAAQHMHLEIQGLERVLPLRALGDGWHELSTSYAAAGSLYSFVLEDGMRIPDPASRFQPMDVTGPSEVVDPSAYTWRDGHWAGMAWSCAVLYELHIGSFTPEGTFKAAIEKLDHLVELGVTGIEVMPIADFPGGYGWGTTAYCSMLLIPPTVVQKISKRSSRQRTSVD